MIGFRMLIIELNDNSSIAISIFWNVEDEFNLEENIVDLFSLTIIALLLLYN